MTRQEFEKLLDAGHIQVLMKAGRWWRARRSGQTKLWKTRPDEFRVPIKAGMYVNGYLTNADLFAFNEGRADCVYRIDPSLT